MSTLTSTQKTARLAMALALFSLALAIGYFSYNLNRLVDSLPPTLSQLQLVAAAIGPLATEVGHISDLTPALLAEVAAVRALVDSRVPPILTELAASRKLLDRQLPALLDELSASRAHIDPILTEVALTREQIPTLLAELAAYRQLAPALLEEIAATRALVPPTLAKVDNLIDKAGLAGKAASEGAVAGVLTGFIKMPLALMSNLSQSVFSNKKLNKKDHQLLSDTAHSIINAKRVGASQSWFNKRRSSGASSTGNATRCSLSGPIEPVGCWMRRPSLCSGSQLAWG